MVFLWFSYGFPMVFPWFSYGFPMVLTYDHSETQGTPGVDVSYRVVRLL